MEGNYCQICCRPAELIYDEGRYRCPNCGSAPKKEKLSSDKHYIVTDKLLAIANYPKS